MTLEEINSTWINVKKLANLDTILKVRSWMNSKRAEIVEVGVDEFGYCENQARNKLLNELETFLNTEIKNLSNNVTENTPLH